MTESPVWLVDASIYVFRPWFTRQPPVFDTEGHAVNAVLGFLRFVYTLLQHEQPTEIGFAFDTSLQTSVRKSLYPAYKANRSPAPENLKYQFAQCRAFLDALGIVQTASVHHEADDVIGTWVAQQHAHGKACKIITGDKDLAQLIGDQDYWWDYGKRAALSAGGIKREFGVWPTQIAEQLAIAGDTADNIPGIPGVGMATAAKLLHKFHNIDNLLSRIPEIGLMKIAGAKRLQRLVEEHRATLLLARQLTRIHCEVPDIPHDLRRKAKDPARLQALCKLLGLSEQQFALWMTI